MATTFTPELSQGDREVASAIQHWPLWLRDPFQIDLWVAKTSYVIDFVDCANSGGTIVPCQFSSAADSNLFGLPLPVRCLSPIYPYYSKFGCRLDCFYSGAGRQLCKRDLCRYASFLDIGND